MGGWVRTGSFFGCIVVGKTSIPDTGEAVFAICLSAKSELADASASFELWYSSTDVAAFVNAGSTGALACLYSP